MENLLHSSVDGRIIEKFNLDGDISVDDQTKIVDAMNQLLNGHSHNVRILRDIAHNSWICLQYGRIEEQARDRIFFITPAREFEWKTFNVYIDGVNAQIKQWLPQLGVSSPRRIFDLSINAVRAENPSNQFLLVLIYAFAGALNYPDCYRKPFGTINSKTECRKVISKALLEKRLPSIEELWGAQTVELT